MNELKAARAVAEHWRRRYQAAQALIAELQGENEQLSNKLDWAREVVIERWTKADEKIAELQGERDELAAGIHRRDARIAELEGRLQAARDNQPGAMTDEWACAINEVHRLRGFIARVEADRDKLREVVHKQEALLDEYAINAAYEHYPAPIIRAHKHQPGSGLLGPYTPPGGRFGCWVDGKPAPPYIEPSETKDTPPSFFQRTLGAVIDFIEQGNEMAALEDKFEALAAELADTPPGIPIQGVDDMYYPIERGRPGESLLGGDTVDEGRFVRRADGSFLWWSDHTREETRHYTPGADNPIDKDEWWIGCESWQTEDE